MVSSEGYRDFVVGIFMERIHDIVNGFCDDESYSSVGIFLKMNGYKLIDVHDKSLQFAMSVENNSMSLEEIAAWLKKNSKKIRK